MGWRSSTPTATFVPSTTTVLRGHSVAVGVLAPIAPLAAQTSYVVRWTPPPSSNLSPTLATFTTGEAADISPPALPIETQRTQVHVDASSGEDPVREHDLIDVTLSHEPGVAVVDVGATTTLDPSTLAGVVTTLGADKLVLGPTAGACGEDDWNAQPSTVRYGAFDVAGNFSGWTPPTALEIAGCSIATHGNGVGLGGALLVLAFLARRRRWRPLA